jgi:hypothetical protein
LKPLYARNLKRAGFEAGSARLASHLWVNNMQQAHAPHR